MPICTTTKIEDKWVFCLIKFYYVIIIIGTTKGPLGMAEGSMIPFPAKKFEKQTRHLYLKQHLGVPGKSWGFT